MVKINHLIRITTIYGEQFLRVEKGRNKIGVFTDKGFIPFDDIHSIEFMGEIKEKEIKNEIKCCDIKCNEISR